MAAPTDNASSTRLSTTALRAFVKAIAALACLAVLGAQAQPAADESQQIDELFRTAERVHDAYGVESRQYLDAVLQILRVVEPRPDQRAAYKRALRMLLEHLRMDLHPSTDLAPKLQLASMELKDANYAAALPLLQHARQSILLLRTSYADAAERWPETRWLDETELHIAECLHHLHRDEEAAAAYAALIARLGPAPPRPEVLARASHNAAALASRMGRADAALRLMEDAVEQTLATAGTGISDGQLIERLRAVVQAAALASPAAGGPRAVARALDTARQARLAQHAPAAYLDLLHAAVRFQVAAGDPQGALRTALADAAFDAAWADAAPGDQLALVLRRAELAAQLGDDAAFSSAWEPLRRAAAALPGEQRRIFAERARVLALDSVGPFISALGQESWRGFRARETAELASALLQTALPPEHPRRRLAALQAALWQVLTLDTPSARSTLEALLGHHGGTQEDEALRAIALMLLGMVHAAEGRGEAAIALGKEALNAFRALPPGGGVAGDCSEAMCLDVQSIARGGRALSYDWLVSLLVRSGRLVEAQQLMQMLREQELAETLRWGSGPPSLATRATLTGLEQQRFQEFHRLREQQAALAAERLALQRLAAKGLRDGEGKARARLQEIDRMEAQQLRPAVAVFLRGLDLDMAAHADQAVVQNSPSVRLESSRIQRDVDQWAREAPQAKAVGVQYLVSRDTLSIIVTLPGLSPIARQLALNRADLYDAVHDAQVLLRSPQSASERLRATMHRLHALLLAPIAQDLHQAGARTLLLSLDDRLRQLPFAALIGADGRYLVEDYALALYNEGAARVAQDSRSREWRVAAMGVSQPVGTLPALTAVPAELAQVVKTSRGGGRTFLDTQFTRETLDAALVRRPAARFNVLHLASHFMLHPGNAADSFLVLGDGSSLSLAEIARRKLDFRGFELVVYSACESGIAGGRGADGLEMESLSALTRRQGAAAVLGTLWQVSDASVADAMAMFYGQSARASGSLAAALQQTQLAMLRGKPDSAGRRHEHPFHWAPLVLMGDWR